MQNKMINNTKIRGKNLGYNTCVRMKKVAWN